MKDKTIIYIISTVVVLIMLIILIGIIAYSNKASKRVYKFICSEGYILNDEKCYKELDSVAATIKYYCNKDYQLNQNQCIKYEEAAPKTGLTCPVGFQMQADNTCYRKQTQAIARIYYKCQYGYTLKGTTCVREVITQVKVEHICPITYNYSQYGNICIARNVTTACPYGTWIYKNIDKFMICATSPEVKYSCPYNAVQIGDKCVETYGSLPATLVKECNIGFVLSNNDTICTKIERIPPINQLHCDTGYNLTNNRCIKTITKNAIKSVTCKKGYTRVDEKCIKYDIKEPIKKEIKN